MQDREREIRRIAVGDIFHASAPNGASLICLAEEVTESAIRARTVTNHFSFEFDRTTGTAEFEYEGRPAVTCTIDSVARLPPEAHAVMLEFDRACASGEDSPFTDEQKRVLLFVWHFYPAHLLPLPWQTMSTGSVAKTEEPDDQVLTLKEYQERLLAVYKIPGPRE